MTDYLFDRSGDDPDVRALEAQLAGFAHDAPLRPPRRTRWLAAAALAAAAVAVFLLWPRGADCAGGHGFAFAVTGGPARCGGSAATQGTLPVGAWLETSDRAVADVEVANIGRMTVFGDSRVRLVGTGASGHHLELARGKLSARVVAPPRLFVVDTPVATAFDLGCAYELAVDADGASHLRVMSGAVSLEGRGHVAYAPAGTEVVARPGRGPGTPIAIQAPEALRAAITRFDTGDAAAVPDIVAASARRDAITLWNLLPRTAGEDRVAVLHRLDALSPRPAGVPADAILASDPAALAAWRAAIEDAQLTTP